MAPCILYESYTEFLIITFNSNVSLNGESALVTSGAKKSFTEILESQLIIQTNKMPGRVVKPSQRETNSADGTIRQRS
jgi:hypothetical protein